MSDDVHDTGWFVYADEPDVRTLARYRPGPNGKTLLDVRKEWRNADAYLKHAADDRAANAGKRWGDGQVFGRMPTHLYFSTGLAEAAKQGDAKFVKKTWNDPDYKYLRTFEGRV